MWGKKKKTGKEKRRGEKREEFFDADVPYIVIINNSK